MPRKLHALSNVAVRVAESNRENRENAAVLNAAFEAKNAEKAPTIPPGDNGLADKEREALNKRRIAAGMEPITSPSLAQEGEDFDIPYTEETPATPESPSISVPTPES